VFLWYGSKDDFSDLTLFPGSVGTQYCGAIESLRQIILKSCPLSRIVCSMVWLGRALALASRSAAKLVPRTSRGTSISETWAAKIYRGKTSYSLSQLAVDSYASCWREVCTRCQRCGCTVGGREDRSSHCCRVDPKSICTTLSPRQALKRCGVYSSLDSECYDDTEMYVPATRSHKLGLSFARSQG
jgi:hypothetical protein